MSEHLPTREEVLAQVGRELGEAIFDTLDRATSTMDFIRLGEMERTISEAGSAYRDRQTNRLHDSGMMDRKGAVIAATLQSQALELLIRQYLEYGHTDFQ